MRRSTVAVILAVLIAGPVPAAILIAPARVVAQTLCPDASASPSAGPTSPEVMPEDYRLALFDGVWKAIDELYIDPAFNGVDWGAVNDEYAGYILQTETAYEVYSLLSEMVGLLGDPLTVYVPPPLEGPAPSAGPIASPAGSLDPSATPDTGYGGIGALMADDPASLQRGQGLRVLYVFAGSPAQDAGIRPRDRIVAVGDDPCPSVTAIRGPVGTTLELTVKSPGEPPRTVTVERRRIDPVITPLAYRLATAPDVGYLRLASLAGQETIDGIHVALGDLLDGGLLSGLVIDLRHTNIGAQGVVVQVLGDFVSGPIGTIYTRADQSPLDVVGTDLLPRLADVPVSVLVDAQTEGESEQLAAFLQAQGRAIVVGQKTTGTAHGVQQIPFPDGSTLQVTTFDVKLADGTPLLREGVTPDITIDADWLDESEAQDSGIAAAIAAIRSVAPSPAPTASAVTSAPTASTATPAPTVVPPTPTAAPPTPSAAPPTAAPPTPTAAPPTPANSTPRPSHTPRPKQTPRP